MFRQFSLSTSYHLVSFFHSFFAALLFCFVFLLFLNKICLWAPIPAHHSLPLLIALRLKCLSKLSFYKAWEGQFLHLCCTHSFPTLPYPAQLERHLQDPALVERHPLWINVWGRLQPSTCQAITMQASMLLFSIQSLKESSLTEVNSCCVFRDVNVLHYLMNCVILI